MKAKDIPPLSSLYFYLTAGCNLACRHCWLAPKYDPEGRRYPTLDVNLFRQILDEAKPLGLQTVKLTGGEPLLHPGIHGILDIVKNEKLSLILETNGLLCDEQTAKHLAEFDYPFVSVSLDGATDEVHDRIRGVPGAFEKAVRGIKVLVAQGIHPQVIFSIMRENVHQIEAIISFAESLGASSVKFNLIQPTERGLHIHEKGQDLTIEEYVEIGKRVEGELPHLTALPLHYDHPIAFKPLHKLADPSGNGGTCDVKHILGVLADGTYALCGIGTSIEEMTFGKAGEDSLEEVWATHPMLATIREDIPEKFQGICGRCLMNKICLGACIAQNYYRARDIHSPFWYCETAEKKGLFPTSRLRMVL